MTEIKLNKAKLVGNKLTRETVNVKTLTITEAGEDGEYIWMEMLLEDGSKYQTQYFKGSL
jgi:hypothetical protein